MERYWIENGILAPNECGGLVKYVDAQATVEALQAQIGSYKLVNDMHLKTVDKLSRQVEALQRERDEAQALVSERASMIGSLTAVNGNAAPTTYSHLRGKHDRQNIRSRRT